jgi:hypothetical protein
VALPTLARGRRGLAARREESSPCRVHLACSSG